MRRVGRLLARDWPLKLAAVALAVVLYGGVVLSENTRTWTGQVPIEVLRPPAGGALLESPGQVGEIRYRAPLDVASRLTNGSFRASIDLSPVRPQVGAPPVAVAVEVFPVDPRVEILDYAPRTVNVRLDEVVTRGMPVTIDLGTVPDGIVTGPLQVEPPRVNVEGASSRLEAIHSIVGRVPVDASGLNVDQDVDLEALDDSGSLVPGVEVRPDKVHVRIDVGRQLAYATVPLVPVLAGAPAEGYRVTGVEVSPQVVTISGEEPLVLGISSVATQPLDVEGRTSTLEVQAGLALPADIGVSGEPVARVVVHIEADEGTRTLEAGLVPGGARDAFAYRFSRPSVLVTLAGPLPVLDALAAEGVLATVPVRGLEPGEHTVRPVVRGLEGVDVLAISPDAVGVVVQVAAPASPAVPSEEAPNPSSTVPASPGAGSGRP